MARVGGQCNCTRVDTFSTEETVFGITVPRDLEALLKATRDVPGLNCRCYLPNISFFTRPSTAVGTYTLRSETTFKLYTRLLSLLLDHLRKTSTYFYLYFYLSSDTMSWFEENRIEDTYDRLRHFSLYVDFPPSLDLRETRSIFREH